MAIEIPADNTNDIFNFKSLRGKAITVGMALLMATAGDLIFSEALPLKHVNTEIPYSVSAEELKDARAYRSSLNNQILNAAYNKDYGRIPLMVEDPAATRVNIILKELDQTDEKRRIRIEELLAPKEITLGDSKIPRMSLDIGAAILGTVLSFGALLTTPGLKRS